MIRLSSIAICALLLCAAECGSSGTNPAPDNGPGSQDGGSTPGGPYSTPFPPSSPQVQRGSGMVLAAVNVVPVFFPGDTLQAGVVSFLQGYVTKSMTWQVLHQYGVGYGTVADPVVLSPAPPASVSNADVRSLLAAQVAAGKLPAPDASTVYVIFYPFASSITMSGATSCKDFAGYHDSAPINGKATPYAVLPRCNRTTMQGLVELTFAVGHEVAEAATDPQLNAYNILGAPYALWEIPLNGAEVGDLCENLIDPFYNEAGLGLVSRLWSNTAAQQLQNPCQPAPAGANFFGVPILSELLPVDLNGTVTNVESVHVVAGQTQALPVRLTGSAASATWTVAAQEVPLPTTTGAAGPSLLTLAWTEAPGRTSAVGSDGMTLHLEITAKAGTQNTYSTVLLTSTGLATGGLQTQTQWVASVRITTQ